MTRAAAWLAAAGASLAILAGCGPVGGDAAELPLRDDFGGQCRWAQASSAAAVLGCVEGRYRVLVKRSERPVAAHRTIERTPAVRIEAEATFQSGPPVLSGSERAVYGVGCWTRVNGDGYLFLVSPAGFALIARVKREVGGFETLAETDEALAEPLVPGESVRVRADCLAPKGEAGRLVLAVNGRIVLAAADPDRPSSFGDLGFYVASTSDGTEVRFDDLAADRLAGRDLEAALAQEEPTMETGNPRTLLSDDFSDEASGWPSGRARFGSFGYTDGAYRVRLDQSGSIRRGLVFTERPVRAIEASMTATERPGRPSSFGIGCYALAERGYLFLVDRLGRWSIRKELAAGGLAVLTEGAGAGLRAPGTPVELAAGCSGSREGRVELAFSVDGDQIGSAVDLDGPRSFRGLAVVVQSVAGDSEIVFDDALVRSR